MSFEDEVQASVGREFARAARMARSWLPGAVVLSHTGPVETSFCVGPPEMMCGMWMTVRPGSPPTVQVSVRYGTASHVTQRDHESPDLDRAIQDFAERGPSELASMFRRHVAAMVRCGLSVDSVRTAAEVALASLVMGS